MTAPLLVTRDDRCSTSCCGSPPLPASRPRSRRDGAAALRGVGRARRWCCVGADLADEVAAPARRAGRGVHVVGLGRRCRRRCSGTRSASAPRPSRSCRARRPGWSSCSPTSGDGGRPRGLVVGVIGGSGGAGATDVRVRARRRWPRGPGRDAGRRRRPARARASTGCSGSRARDGIRWDALCQTTGRLSARSLREALPRRGGLGGADLDAGRPASLQAFAVREALSAAQRGHDTVVVDLPRSPGRVVDEGSARCDRCWWWSVPTVPGVASAARVCAPARRARRGCGWCVRGQRCRPDESRPGHRRPRRSPRMADQRGLDEAIDLGLGPVRSRRGAARPGPPTRCCTAARRVTRGRGMSEAVPADCSTAVRDRLARDARRR